MPIRHIYWFAYFGSDEPSVRYRGIYPLQQLKETKGITHTIIFPGYHPKNILRFASVYLEILLFRKKDSVTIYEKLRTRRVYTTLLKLLSMVHRKRTMYDIDDAEYLKFPPGTIRHFIKYCAVCSTGSEILQSYAKQYNENVFMLTSPIVAHNYVHNKRNAVFTIGWVGYYRAHKDSLFTLLFPAIAQLSFPVKLVLLGVHKPEHIAEVERFFSGCTSVTIEMPQQLDWKDEDDIYQRIALFDLGVAPLLDTEMNRAKSAFKLKQYLSCGVPALASDVGENSVFLKEGINGYLCRTPEDYERAISAFYFMDEDAYRVFCKNARLASGAFSMDRYCDTLLEQLEKL